MPCARGIMRSGDVPARTYGGQPPAGGTQLGTGVIGSIVPVITSCRPWSDSAFVAMNALSWPTVSGWTGWSDGAGEVEGAGATSGTGSTRPTTTQWKLLACSEHNSSVAQVDPYVSWTRNVASSGCVCTPVDSGAGANAW